MNELALFAGAGGGILGGSLLGWRTVCAVEINPYGREVLAARQNDGHLEPFPIWDDVTTFDGEPWRGLVDVVSGGFPCQDISVSGLGIGINGKRSGLYRELIRIVREVGPRYAFLENSPMLTSRGLGQVLGDLASVGYDAKWCVLGADDAGAPHKRKRIWIRAELSDPNGLRELQQEGTKRQERGRTSDIRKEMANTESEEYKRWRNRTGWRLGITRNDEIPNERRGDGELRWWGSEPDVGRVANGVASRVDRLHALGNGQVPAVAALAWRILTSIK